MILSAFAFALMDGVVKYLDHVSSYQLVFFRAVVSLILCLTYLQVKQIPMLGTRRTLLLLRGIVGTISMTLFFLAVKHIPLGSAVTLRYLSPIFAAVLALIFLGERIRKIQWIFFLMAFSGAAMLKGFDFRITTIGFSLILGSAIFSGMVYAIIKKIGGTEHPLVIVNYFMFVATVSGFCMALPSWQNPVGFDWILLSSLGLFGFFGQLFMTMAIQSDLLTRVIPFKYAEALLAVIIGLIWFGEGFGTMAVVGMILILAGMILNALFSKKNIEPDDIAEDLQHVLEKKSQ